MKLTEFRHADERLQKEHWCWIRIRIRVGSIGSVECVIRIQEGPTKKEKEHSFLKSYCRRPHNKVKKSIPF